VAGYAIVGGGINKVYGGWLCGVSTAMYQGMLTNLWLQVVEYRAHSIYYRTYYVANINGILAYQPWLDATLYLWNPDMQVKNIRAYPIVAVFNYDWSYWGAEDMFTLSKAQDRGTFEYVGSPSKNCYTRNINGEDRTNCYTKIEN
jgi:vancomycin resistance protein YoaR